MGSVLVLDDRQSDRQLLTTLLAYAGHQVLEATTGEEALRLARSERPDLIITDIVMPSMNGYEFVRRLRDDPAVADTSVVFCTANYVEGEVRQMAASCGVSRFLPKPADPQTILSTIGEVLDSPEPRPRPVVPADFDREQLRLLNDKLAEKVGELETVSAERQRLVAQLLRAHEQERRRIADSLHDDSIQAVVAVGLRLEMLARQLERPEDREAAERLHADVSHAIERLRNMLFELQPVELTSQGLGVALEVYLERARKEDGLAYELTDRRSNEPAESVRTLLYRTAQEAVMNVRKHARASRVDVLLDNGDGEHVVRVRDDGRGFSPEQSMRVRPGHLGLPSIRERLETAGGSLRVQSSPGDGATIEIRVPETLRAE
jgi:signal transduction histidine kinase